LTLTEGTIKISQAALAEFMAIHLEEYGQGLSSEEAQEMALRLLRLFSILIRPLSPPLS